MGRVIGNETGKALVVIASSAAGGGGAAKGPTPPPVRPPPTPPARVVVGQPMNAAGQVAKTQPAAATTVRDPTMPTLMKPSAWRRLVNERAGGKAQRLAWELENKQKMKMWGEAFDHRIMEAQPEMAKMVEETGTAAPIIRRISQELAGYPSWD